MHLPKRYWSIAGFAVSVVSVVVNTLIIANFNEANDVGIALQMVGLLLVLGESVKGEE
jgi:hypothetical protein